MTQELLLDIWKDLKLTVILVTHDIEEAIFVVMGIGLLGLGRVGIGGYRWLSGK